MQLPDFADVQAAYGRIQSHIHRTPVLKSEGVNRIAGASVFFKCENFQKVGAFKFRGACNAVFSLPASALANGVATHSSGNHAAALALAARMRGCAAHIVMPETSRRIKIEAVREYGGNIVLCEPTLEARETTLERVVAETGATFIHPYNNPFVIAGQGTAALELLADVADLDIVMAPVGGGGLLSGTALSTAALAPSTQVIAGEPSRADDAYRSFTSGILEPSVNPHTIADGLLTSLGDLTFAIIRKHVKDIITVPEEAIVHAMRIIWERMKIIVEPSSAVPFAAVLENPERFQGKRVGIILSGGNVDLGTLPFVS